jgi:acetolactate synthase-1/2/3 large subunit
MGTVLGGELLAQALRSQGVDTMFYVMGGPMLETEATCIKLGIRAIDTRHEQAAARAPTPWGRVTRKPGVAIGCSGPGATNLLTGVANAFTDAAPLVAIGGSSPRIYLGMEAFQEIDQVAVFKPVTKWADRIYDARRIPRDRGHRVPPGDDRSPGPVYSTCPATCWARRSTRRRSSSAGVEDDAAAARRPGRYTGSDRAARQGRAAGDPRRQRRVVVGWRRALPAIRGGDGVPLLHHAHLARYGSRGPRLAFLNARSTAFTEADVLLTVGTRFNWVVQYGRPPRFARPSRSSTSTSTRRSSAGTATSTCRSWAMRGRCWNSSWRRAREARSQALRGVGGQAPCIDAEKNAEQEKAMSTDNTPIHPLRLCKEVRDFMKRDAILVVDGQEILNYGRQSIPTFTPGHRLNSGAFGCMGVGLPFGVGAKVAKPDTQVRRAARRRLLRHQCDGDRHRRAPQDSRRHRHLEQRRLDRQHVVGAAAAQARPQSWATRATIAWRMELGAHGEFVEKPSEIRPALERAYASGKPAVVNVITDDQARAQTCASRVPD